MAGCSRISALDVVDMVYENEEIDVSLNIEVGVEDTDSDLDDGMDLESDSDESLDDVFDSSSDESNYICIIKNRKNTDNFIIVIVIHSKDDRKNW